MLGGHSVFVTCAVTGGGDTVGKHPAIPVTPEQIAQAALEAASAGAAIVHCHVRDPQTGKSSNDPALYREVVDRIRSADPDLVINLTGGMGGNLKIGDAGLRNTPADGSFLQGPLERIAHAELLPDICSLDCGSMNFYGDDSVYIAPPIYLRRAAEYMAKLGVKPEFELFDAGQLWMAKTLIEEGFGGTPPLLQLCMGIRWGAPQDLGILKAMVDLMPPGAIWSSFGIGRHQMQMVAQSALLGGNIRVGLEDNLYLDKGVFASNGQLVEKATKILALLGFEVLGPKETRKVLALRGA
jgi:uncharacterized protein (DUF849 family)